MDPLYVVAAAALLYLLILALFYRAVVRIAEAAEETASTTRHILSLVQVERDNRRMAAR